MSQFVEQERDTAQAADPIVDHHESAATDAADQQAASHLANAQIQMRFGGPETSSAEVRDAAAEGTKGTPSALPHADRIQASFGRHDIGSVKAHVGERAASASEAMGANAFATGSHVGFAGQPDLHTAAHEAAHVVQQRGGVQLKDGVGESGDRYERNADAVADQVVAGRSAAPLLDTVAGASEGSATGTVQRKDPPPIPGSKKRPSVKSLNLPKKTRAKRSRHPVKQKPKRPSVPKPKRPKSRKPRRIAKPKKIEPVIEEELLDEIEPDVEEEPLEEIQPDGTIMTPHRVDGKWLMIEEEPLEEVEPTEEDLKGSTVEPAVVVDDETTKANTTAKERVELGAEGVEFLKGGVQQSKDAWEIEQEEQEKAPAPEKKKKGGGIFGKIFRGLKSMFSSKSSNSEDDEIPMPIGMENSREYDTVKTMLGTLKSTLLKYVPKLQVAIATGADIAKNTLITAKADVDETADAIKGKVEENHVYELQDIGVGILSGSKEMLKGAMQRGKIAYNSLKTGTTLAKGGSTAIIMNARYLNMAELAFKTDRTKMEEGEEHDLVKEDRIMRKFDHPNMLKSGGLTTRRGRPGYVMEKQAFGDLKGVFANMHKGKKTGRKLPQKKDKAGQLEDERTGVVTDIQTRLLITRYLIRDAFLALKVLHDENIVHGDIKHENFLLGEDLKPKMMDFGMSHDEDDEDTVAKKSGTGPFMAPEVAANDYSKKPSDVWSLGETLLYGVFDWDSIDFMRNKKITKDFGKEGPRVKMSDSDWQGNLETKANALEGKTDLISFVKGAMCKDVTTRMTVDAALDHPFLKFQGTEEDDAKKALGKVV